MKIRVLSLLQDGQKEIVGAVANSAFTAVGRTDVVLNVLKDKNIINRTQAESAEVEVKTEFEDSMGSMMVVVVLADGERVLVDAQLTELV